MNNPTPAAETAENANPYAAPRGVGGHAEALPTSVSDTSIYRVVLASLVGTTIEWYDFFLYGTAAALVFDQLFFPELDPVAGRMAAFATYAVGFFARPVGGVVFGHFGDRLGRKSMLVTTLMLMGLATFLIGVLPTYSRIGVAAPLLLIALRFVQGFGVGGEWGGAVLMVVEHGHRGRRGLYASWVQAGVPAGMLLATAVFALFNQLPEAAFMSWGWRVPFLLGIALLAVGMFIRLQVLESPLFEKVKVEKQQAGIPFFAAMRRHPGNILLAMGARMAENACFYIFTVFVLSYATDRLEVERSTILNGVLLASGIEFFVIPAFGMLSDRVGRRPVFFGGAIALGLYAFPFFWLFDTANITLMVLAILIGLLIHAAMYAPLAAFLSELFGTEVRYTGASIGYQLASPLAGGLAPLVCVKLLEWSDGKPWPVSLYLIGFAAVTLVSVWLAAETHRSHLGEHADHE